VYLNGSDDGLIETNLLLKPAQLYSEDRNEVEVATVLVGNQRVWCRGTASCLSAFTTWGLVQ
jgi:hypothetical protein